MDPRHEVYAARMHLELRRGATPRIAFLVLAVLAAVATGLAPGAMRAQDPSPTASSPALTLAGRLPAQIDGSPVQLDETTDLAAYLEAAYAGETGPELDALDAALAEQGASPADVELVWASAFDSEVLIGGFRLPGGDASAFRAALLGVYFLGFDGLEQAEMDVQGRSVTTVSQGPVADDPYPFAVLTDGDTLWIASVSSQLLEPTVTALVGAAGGTVARYDAGAVVDAGYAAPWGWEGTVSLTTTWNKNSYRGTSSARMTGTWLQPLTTDRVLRGRLHHLHPDRHDRVDLGCLGADHPAMLGVHPRLPAGRWRAAGAAGAVPRPDRRRPRAVLGVGRHARPGSALRGLGVGPPAVLVLRPPDARGCRSRRGRAG